MVPSGKPASNGRQAIVWRFILGAEDGKGDARLDQRSLRSNI